MSEADELRGLISQLSLTLMGAVADGSTATQLGNETIDSLSVAKSRMTDSRVTALQAIGQLQDAEQQAQLLFQKTVSAEASDLIGQIRKARELVNNYVNHLTYRIDRLDQLTALMNQWVTYEMSQSGSHLRVANDKLQELSLRY